LRHLRTTVAEAAARYGLAPIAAATHPFARWGAQKTTERSRYATLRDDLQGVGQRLAICGLHVHVGVPEDELRIDLLNQASYFLPHLLALSTSSPFWQSRRTGLKGYRLAAYDELPRSGLPALFRTKEEFDAYVAAMVRAGVINDSSYIWWAIRPSLNHPTLELRAPDCCTLVEDSIAIAALYRSLVRHLFLNPACNAAIDVVGRAIAVENKWRAQRYGAQGTFVTRSGGIAVGELLNTVLDLVTADAKALDCSEQVEYCRTIVSGGTSADAQLQIFTENKHEGAEIALHKVSRWIKDATLSA